MTTLNEQAAFLAEMKRQAEESQRKLDRAERRRQDHRSLLEALASLPWLLMALVGLR